MELLIVETGDTRAGAGNNGTLGNSCGKLLEIIFKII
jgi:hypothetical protein